MIPLVNVSPLETEEQIDGVQWLELQGLKFTAIPNATYNPHRSQQAKNRREGLRPGLSDLLITITATQAIDNRGHLIFAEMKRIKTFKISDDQKGWSIVINGLEIPGVEYIFAHGADELKDYIRSLLKKVIEYNI